MMLNRNGNSNGNQARLTAHERAIQEREARIKDLLPDEDADSLGKIYDSRLLKRLLDYVLVYKGKLIASVIFMSLASIFSVAGPWIVGKAIDEGIRAQSLSVLYKWVAIFAAVAVGEWFTNRLRIVIMAYVGTKIVADMRSALFRHLHRLSLNFHNSYSVGRLMSRLISDVGVLQDFVTWSITGMARSIFVLGGIMVVMLAMNWQLALVTFAIVPLVVLLAAYWRTHVRDAYRATRQRLSLINGYLNESISGIRVTKSFTREAKNSRHFDDLNLSYFDANVRAAKLTATFLPGIDFLGSVATALVLGLGGWLVLRGELTAGVLIAFVLYIDRFFDPIRELAQRYNIFQAAMAGCERIFGLLDIEPDLKDPEKHFRLPEIEGQVEFEHVSFAYKEDEPVLRDFTLTAEPGQRVALVGETGAGKSTVIRLLARFFDVTGGSIKIDGHDLRQVTQASLRSQLGIVLQDTFLFNGTIADNIRYGHLEAGDDEVVAAARAVGADDFIQTLPQKYETEVSENGSSLSVGQRQMLSFARALLADPHILILDEATSSVDTTTERQIDQALDLLMKDRTSFVIAHRLSTIVGADKIVVMDHGQIVELGTHEELLARQGRYYNLYTMQWAQDKPQVSLKASR
jgi:ATP-binding cassette subfamily B protein/subfamily B ATP-binding cassette protein MsbA